MAVNGTGITFAPLYWVHHDQWKYYYKRPDGHGGYTIEEHDHYGHSHLFLMGFDLKTGGADAWYGSQTFKFQLQDIWGPRSSDPNQQFQYRVVGTPKWYFHVEEVWRRVYVQPWDAKVDTDIDLLKRGLRWDCVGADKQMGPFREGLKFAPAYLKYARTLPIDYFTNDAHSQVAGARTNHVKDAAEAAYKKTYPEFRPNTYNPASYNPAVFDLDHGNYLYAGGDGGTPEPAAKPPFNDRLYIWPIMEYQTVTQLDWERWPGFEARNDRDPGESGEQNGEAFGDGWEVSVSVPFIDPGTNKYRSPFAPPNTYDVRPVGQYFNNLVPEANKPRYPEVHYDDPDHPPTDRVPNYYDHPDKLPPELSGQPMGFHNPFGEKADGRWIQQCLGGKILARCRLVLEHKLGGRQVVEVGATQYMPTTPFAGSDQGTPASP